MKLLHARFWKYDGNYPEGKDCERYDPHGFGLGVIAHMADLGETEYQVNGVSLDGVIVRHHKGYGFGHQVHVAATKAQWEAVEGDLLFDPR
jgi:hypothetical protein